MRTGTPNLYELLEVDEAADGHEIALAFKRVAKRWHPDLNSTLEATGRMQEIAAAYEVLRDPARRSVYDLSLCARRRPVADEAGGGREQTWRRPAPKAPDVKVIDVTGPPQGYLTAPGRLRGARARMPATRPSRKQRVLNIGGAGALSLVCLTACPFVAFLMAAWRTRQRELARWAALYALAPIAWTIGQLSDTSSAVLAGRTLLLLGALHFLCWRRRLLPAIMGEPEANR